MKPYKQWLHLCLVFCLTLGWAIYLPIISPATAFADDPPPPAEELEPAAPEVSPTLPALTEEEIELRAALDALATARQLGPEAVVALLDTLSGRALDLVMDEILEAQEQLARSAPPLPERAPMSLAEEDAALQAQTAQEAAIRAMALAAYPSLEEEEILAPDIQPPTSPDAPAAELTVGSSPCKYKTIADALTAANPGDRLLIEGGVTFKENIIIQKSLTLQGGYKGCGSGSSAPTTIDGSGAGRVVYIYQNLTVTLENLIITKGYSTGNGAGIYVNYNSQLKGTNLDIYNNKADGSGGGVRLYGGKATFSDTNIHGNLANEGAGISGNVYSTYAPVLDLQSNADVYLNQALTGTGLGGGVYLNQGTVSVADCADIYSNTATHGGGAYLIASTLTIGGSCSEIQQNTATGSGGGIYAQDSIINLDDQAELYNNNANNGGGAYLDNSDLMSDKALIRFNTANNYGGGVYATNGSLLDMDLGSYPCTGPRCSQLSDNTASSSYGGGVYTNYSEIDLQQTFVEKNTAYYGGGIYALQSQVYLYNTLMAKNNATGSIGDGLRLFTSSNLSGQNNTLAHNNAGGATNGFAISMSGATLSLSNSVIWGHATSIDLAGQAVTCSDIQGSYAGTGNLDLDPLFIDPASDNFHLQSLSPVIDRCAAGQTRDFDNEIRPVTYIRPASPYDMGADEASRRVGINGAACAYGRIQDAVDAALAGDTIQAVEDVFLEAVNINGKKLTIAGGYDVDCATHLAGGGTTVNGGGEGSVFDITNSSLVTLRDLYITGGKSGIGGGVDVYGGSSQVTLDNTEVFENQAGQGSGVVLDPNNMLTLTNGSHVQYNVANIEGGGAYVRGKLVGDDLASSIAHNTAPDGGGASVPGGELEFSGSHILYNQATGASGRGGGIFVSSGGVITMTDSSNVANNSAYNGAGIYADHASINLNSAFIHTNSATNNGGGVHLVNGSTLTATNTYIGYPTAEFGRNTAINGAGLYIDASTLDFDGSIVNNIASIQGGGIYATASTLNLNDARVGAAGANNANQLGPTGHKGAGLYIDNGTLALLEDTIISSNAFQTDGYTYGGGAYITGSSIVTMTHGTVERHLAPSTVDGRGAGLYIQGGTVTLDASQVLSNTAGATGGGIRLFESSILNIVNGSELRNNQAANGAGGAISATGTPDINISASRLKNNTAHTHGGAVYLNAGTLDFTGWWELSGNVADGNGGAVAVADMGNAGFYSTTAGSSIINNHASGNGGALYVNNNTTLELYSTGGYLLSIGNNFAANGNGGAVYADNGGMFDVYGRLVFTANRAPLGNGGVFFLSNGSKLWLDDYANDFPELRENWAQNGGAIYAQNSPKVECDGAKFGYTPGGNFTTSGSGGAIYLDSSTFDADNCVFYNNQASVNGGAIAAYNTSTLNVHASLSSGSPAPERTTNQEAVDPQSILATYCNPLAGQCSSFNGNLANTGYGGAIYTNNSTLNASYTYLHHNRSVRGGAIFQTGASATAQVSNTLIYKNSVTTAYGAGIRKEGGNFTLRHTTIADNAGGAGYSGSASEVSNTIAWGNDMGGFSAVPVVAACNIDQSSNAGSSTDPLFVAPGAGENYHLRGTSPAIDACTTGLSPDLENRVRPFGIGYDMGAFEYIPYKIHLPLIIRQ